MTPKLIIHGGCGRFEGRHSKMEHYDAILRSILNETFRILKRRGSRAACFHGMKLLEDASIFNAGYGSKLQRDGAARMSAAFMDGKSGKFSAVINVEDIQHPIELARILNRRKHSVLAGDPAKNFAREEKLPAFNPIAPHRLKEHQERMKGETGTCGIVALDRNGHLCVATSTGGIGYEVPGRVGDSPTVAGTYANPYCGVSCTGIGEHIVNLAVAAKISTRIEDGQDLQAVVNRVVDQGNEKKFRFGMIALDHAGNIAVGQTRKVTVLSAWHDGEHARSFLDMQKVLPV